MFSGTFQCYAVFCQSRRTLVAFMSFLQLILRSLRFHWRTNLAVACGVAVGTAVLTGDLLVGGSMRGSLRHLVLDRLGRIDEALVADHFFRAALADEWKAGAAAPAILLEVSIENADLQAAARANRVQLVGCDARFWRLGDGGLRRTPQAREIVLNQPLAQQLGVRPGDTVLLRLPRLGAIPADNALGKKRDTVRTQRVTVSEIIPAEGLGRFGLRPTQRISRNAYVSLSWLEARLEQPGRANAILVSDITTEKNSRELTAPGSLAGKLQLADYGLSVDHTAEGYRDITTDRMLFDPTAERAILNVVGGERQSTIQPALTYLANTLACHGREVPYSTITAIDFAARPPLGPFVSTEGKPVPPLGSDEIALNTWAADQLHAKLGDTVRVSYFEPESVDGQVHERSVALRLAAVVKLAGAADDRRLTPSVKGITDELTMADWDPPFPFDANRIRPADEAYWNHYGPTPKAFVSLATGRRLWASRFGQTTSIRVADAVGSLSTLHSPLSTLPPAAMGMAFQPVKLQSLLAAAGTTPFGVLFLCFSFFIIAAAVMLTALLFRLGADRRAVEIGTLLAVGFTRRKVGRLLLGEGLAVAAVGSVAGVLLGVGYAALMLLGLRTWWQAAVAMPELRLYMTTASLVIGGASGLVIASLAIWLSSRRLGRLAPRRLLAGQTIAESRASVPCPRSPWACRARVIELMLLIVALLPPLALMLVPLNEEIRAGALFASGATALAALLGLVRLRLRAGRTGSAVTVGRGNLMRLALRNAAPTRAAAR